MITGTSNASHGTRHSLLHGLDFLWLEITEKCNLSCSHCYVGSTPDLPLDRDMTPADWCRVLDQASELGCRGVQFIGGEPTIHPHLPELLRHARNAGFEFCEVYTNATVLRPALLDVFRDCGVQVAFSIYCDTAEVHDRITGRVGSFDKTVAGIRNMVDLGIPTRAGVIVMNDNAERVDQTLGLLEQIGVDTMGTDVVRGIGRGFEHAPNESPEGELCGACWEGRLCIDSSGDAFPCVFSKFVPVGNVLRQELSDLVGGAPLSEFRHRMFEEVVCTDGEKCRPGPCKPGNARIDDGCRPDPCKPGSGDDGESAWRTDCAPRPCRPGTDDDAGEPEDTDDAGCQPRPCRPGSDSAQPVLNGCRPGPCKPG